MPDDARHGLGGNGGPPLDDEPARMTPGQAIVRGGELLYGRRFTQELAEDLGEDPRQVRRWLSGEAVPGDRPIAWLRNLAVRRAVRLLDLADALAPPAGPEPVEPKLEPEVEPEPEVDVAAGIRGEDAAFFLKGLTCTTGGLPTPLRAITAVRMNPRARVWTATVTIFDGSQHTLACDRGDDRTETAVRFSEGPSPERRELQILWDEEAGTWSRQPDRLNGPPRYVPPPRAEDDPSHVPQPFNPHRPRGALRSPRRAAAAADPQGRLF